jgi:hypothetical protein
MDFWNRREMSHTTITTIHGYQAPSIYIFPEYSKEGSNKIPDFRSILYWNPSIVCSSNSTEQIEFYTSDEVGMFEVNLFGVLEDYSTVHIRKYIQVK